jgi:hypothetical protein
LSKAEERRREEIVEIQTLLREGFAPVQIKEMLHTTYFRIRRYATGDPTKLCRFPHKPSPVDPFRDVIIELLHRNTPYKQALTEIQALGYLGKRTAFVTYCRNLIAELDIPYAPTRTAAGVMVSTKKIKPQHHYVSRADVFRWLWSEKELDVKDQEYILVKYPLVDHLRQCIADFRMIYKEKSPARLDAFIANYAGSESKPIQSFASGLRMDIEAVKNSVTSDLSSGFVEGIINKIKAIKRTMFGRAKIDLLRIKVLFAR